MSSEQLQGFFESLTGQIVTVAVILLLFLGILISGKNRKPDTKGLVLSALFAALYLVLNQFVLLQFPQGGSITLLSMFAVTSCAYLLGVRRALMAGMCAGLVSLIFNPYVIHPLQLLLDYPLAVGALGFAGLFANRRGGLIIGYLVGVLCRYFCVTLSGIVFFGEYAAEGFNAVTWSLYYNGCYIAAEAALTVFVLSLPPVRKAFRHMKNQLH